MSSDDAQFGRRAFISMVAGSIIVPRAGETETDKVWRVALMHVGLDHVPPSWEPLREELRALGYEDGRNIRLDFRNVADQAAANATARKFVRDHVDLVVAFEEQAMRAIMAATSVLPVVFLHLVDPVADGFVKSLARPGGNATGFITWAVLPSKQIELFSEFLPRPHRLMVLVDPKDAPTRRQLAELRGAGGTLGIQMVEHEVTTQRDVERALDATDRSKVDGVFVLSRTLGTNFPSLILRLSTAKRLPLLGSRKEWVEQGALFSYAPDLAAIGRQAAPYVAKILSGTSPGDLPVQEPTKFELVINRRIAKALGLTIPQPLMLQADQVID